MNDAVFFGKTVQAQHLDGVGTVEPDPVVFPGVLGIGLIGYGLIRQDEKGVVGGPLIVALRVVVGAAAVENIVDNAVVIGGRTAQKVGRTESLMPALIDFQGAAQGVLSGIIKMKWKASLPPGSGRLWPRRLSFQMI